MDRIQQLRAHIGVLAGSLRFRADLELNRLPTSIRSMTVEEFWFKYNGDAKEYLKLQARVKTEANTSFLHAIGMDHKRYSSQYVHGEENHRKSALGVKDNSNNNFFRKINRKREGSESVKDQREQSKRNKDDATVSGFLLLRRKLLNPCH